MDAIVKTLFSYLICLLVSLCNLSYAQEEVWMIPNKGQWEEQVNYKVQLSNGAFFIEDKTFTFALYESPSNHNHGLKRKTHSSKIIKGHVVKQHFFGANTTKLIESKKSSHFYNYFIGNDSSKWKSEIYGVQGVNQPQFYKGTSLFLDASNQGFEYSFRIEPFNSPALISSKIEGATNCFIGSDGDLHIQHSIGEIIQKKPIAWNLSNKGEKTSVPVCFKLKNDTLSFEFPKGYSNEQTLIIDPKIEFSTFSGSLVDNWGFTACPDSKGNLIAGGISFGIGYPSSVGSFQPNFSGGTKSSGHSVGFDISISKFSADGKKQIYATYIGGNGNETPNSIICSKNNDLYILGVTSSSNYPVSASAFDKSYNGGLPFDNKEFTFGGTDIFITKLNALGSAILGSTYYGGSNSDGLNTGDLAYNYGDEFRGEINLSSSEEVIIASCTKSIDIPLKSPFQNTLKGEQDALISKFSSDLSALIWGSYLGGNGFETGNGITFDLEDNILVTGGSTSNDLTFPNGYLTSYQGGNGDAYIIKLTGKDFKLKSGTFIGTSSYDQSYFIQTDKQNNTYILGQTDGEIGITPGKFGIPNSGQFICKFDASLKNQNWITTIGSGQGFVEISPTAFSVSECNEIFFCGWGGEVNVNYSKAKQSSSKNLPISKDAFQLATKGNNFYLCILSNDAQTLKYGSYFGGLIGSYNHVDGGTSRFDKNGGIYHAVCGGCEGVKNGFTTTASVYSETNKSSNCNLAAFKFSMNKSIAIADIMSVNKCVSDSIKFINNSQSSNKYEWDFGDFSTSSLHSPSHSYSKAGTYSIRLIASDSLSCSIPDTTILTLIIEGVLKNSIATLKTVCPGTEIALNPSFISPNVKWYPSTSVKDSLILNTTAIITKDIHILIIGRENCSVFQEVFPFKVYKDTLRISEGSEICQGSSVSLFGSGAQSYEWSPKKYLSSPLTASTQALPDTSITYSLTGITSNNCKLTKNVYIKVVQAGKSTIPKDTFNICEHQEKEFVFLNQKNMVWEPSSFVTQTAKNNFIFRPKKNSYFYTTYENICGLLRDSIYFNIYVPEIWISKDTIICEGNKVLVQTGGAIDYKWSNQEDIEFISDNEHVRISPKKETTYIVIGKDIHSCYDTVKVNVKLHKKPKLNGETYYIKNYGENIELNIKSSTEGSYSWKPEVYLSCTNCKSPTSEVNSNINYTVFFTDRNGCSDSLQINIVLESDIYVPNTFTPNGNIINESFKAITHNISEFEMTIFNRWGELLKTLHSVDETWDGKHNDFNCADGTYIWKIMYVDSTNERKIITGHINLLR